MPTYAKGKACAGAKHVFKTTASGKTKICRKCGSVRPGPKGKGFGRRIKAKGRRARRLRK